MKDSLGLAAVIIIVCILIMIVPLMFMILWNLLMPDIFNLPTIGFWQSCGLLTMVYLLSLGVKSGKGKS